MGGILRRRVVATALTAAVTASLAPVVPLMTMTAHAAAPAEATVPNVGPIDPNTGYPFWYQDTTGERYRLCLDRATPATGTCLATAQDPAMRPWVDQDPAKTNLAVDGEVFWYDAGARIRENGVTARFTAATEATFGGTDLRSRAGDQISFGRLRIRVNNLVPGSTYVVTHPYGKQTFVAEDQDGDPATGQDGQIRFTEDIGCFDLPCDFTKADASSVTSYLRWDPTVGPAAPEGFVGTPDVDHEVVGSPMGTNYFRVAGPGIGGQGKNAIETDLFSLQGQLWTPTQPMLGVQSNSNLVDFGRTPYVAPDPSVTPPPPAGQTVTLTNAGGGVTPLSISALSVTGSDAGAFTVTGEDCTTAAAGLTQDATCSVAVAFDPQHAGTSTAQLEVLSNGADAQPSQRILLRGVGSDGTDPADLRATGPLSLEHGYPLWYQDESGVQLALCDDPIDPMCLPPAAPFDPLKPMVLPGNFPEELFWWSGTAKMPTNGGEDALLVMGQEAAFALGPVVPGDQIAFGRMRLRVGGLTAGETYTVTTPYGTRQFVAADDPRRGINATEDLGCLETPCDFTKVNRSEIGPFLQQAGAPAGYVGDPDVESTVTGGPNGNVFRVEGPDVGGPGVDVVETDLFAVSGKRWTPPAQGTLALQETSNVVDVGAAAPGTSSEPRTVTLTNVGQAAAQVGRLTLPAASPFVLSQDGCSNTTVAPGGVCTVGVTLSPKASTTTAGQASADLAVSVGKPAKSVGSVLLRGRVNVAGAGRPGPTLPGLSPVSDTGLLATDAVTRATTVTLTGAAASGQTVTVLVDGTPVGTVDPLAGAWSLPVSLTAGSHVVTAAYADGSTSAPLTVTVDRTPPAGRPEFGLAAAADTGVPGDGVTANTTPTLTGTVAPAAPAGTVGAAGFAAAAVAPAGPTDVAAVRVVLNGSLVGVAPVAADGTWRFTLPRLTATSNRVTARAVDLAGNVGPVSDPMRFRVDVRRPTVSPPTVATARARLHGVRVGTTLRWSGRDDSRAPLTYQLQVSRNGAPFTQVHLPRARATSVVHRAPAGRLRYRVRATDAAGNTSAWRSAGAVRTALVQQQDPAVRYTGRWQRRKPAFASGGSLRFARNGATATLTTRARSVSVVSGTGPQRGRAAILVNGRRVRTVNLWSAAGSHRLPVATVAGLSPRQRTRVEVRVLGTRDRRSSGTRVDLDAFVVMR